MLLQVGSDQYYLAYEVFIYLLYLMDYHWFTFNWEVESILN
jgi:hypothetical protein